MVICGYALCILYKKEGQSNLYLDSIEVQRVNRISNNER